MPSFTYVYEVKPASDQVSEIKPGRTGPRGANNAVQIAGYIQALVNAGWPNPEPGIDIIPTSKTDSDGSTLTIFSGSDWSQYARSGARPAEINSGIIYYWRTRPPRTPVPPPISIQKPSDKNTEQKQDPRDTPTIGPTDGGVPADDGVTSQLADDLLVAALVVAVAALIIVLLPEEVVAAAAAAVVTGVAALASWAFSW